ncbi:MAG: dTDP-4-dehydrorhamnose reductase [Patescibacteria group bacterium]
MDKTKIIITGANGMLGHDLQEKFKDFNLLCFDKDNLDITNYKQVSEIISREKPQVVINAAAYTDVDGCETNKDLCMQINGYGVGNLAQACKENDVILVHYSTDYIFNGQNKDGYSEDYNEIDPISVYGQSKALGEKLIKENCDKYYILRTAWLYGKNGKNFVDTMIKLGQEKDELKVVDDQHGSPTFSKDLAQETKKIIANLKPDFGVFHVTNSGNCTWFEFAKGIFNIKNIKIKLEPCTSNEFPRPARRPKYSILLNTKLSELRTWQEALKDYLKD